MQLIGLSGKAGTGKNYLARHLLAPHGFREAALADEIKIRGVALGVGTYEELFHAKPAHTRDWLQQEGTERGREQYGVDVWINAMMARLTRVEETWGIGTFVVTDVRFPNEVEVLQAHGGRVFRIEAPERAAASLLSDAARAHPSETALDDYEHFDGWIFNDPIYAHTVAWQLHMLLLRGGTLDQVPNFDGPISEQEKLLWKVIGMAWQ